MCRITRGEDIKNTFMFVLHVLMTETMSLKDSFYVEIRHQISFFPRLQLESSLKLLETAIGSQWMLKLFFASTSYVICSSGVKKVLEHGKINLLINIRTFSCFATLSFFFHQSYRKILFFLSLFSMLNVWYGHVKKHEEVG